MRLEDVLGRQHGVIALHQAHACGLATRTVRRRVLSRAWWEVLPAVYVVGGYRFGDRARVHAVSLWGGEAGVVSGMGAAFWHGLLDRAGAPVEITMPRSTTRPSRDIARVRRRDLDPLDRTVRCGVAVTAVPLTVLETAALVPRGDVVLDRALQQRRVTFTELHEAYCRAGGARGMGRAGALLTAAGVGAESALERRLVTALRRAGMPGLVVGHPFGDSRIDVAFPHAKVAVEIDSWAWHTDPDRFAADRAKGNALVASGWTVLRFTWHDVTHRLPEVIARVRAAVTR